MEAKNEHPRLPITRMNPTVKDAVPLLEDRSTQSKSNDYQNIWGFVTSEPVQGEHKKVEGKNFFYLTNSFRGYVLVDEADKFIKRGGIIIHKDEATEIKGQIGKIALDSGIQYSTVDANGDILATFDISHLASIMNYKDVKPPESNTLAAINGILNSKLP